MNDNISYTSLTFAGDNSEREILSSFLQEHCLGILDYDNYTNIYFQNINKTKIEKIIKVHSNISEWSWDSVKKQDWLENWKPFFKDILIDNKVIVIPEWNKRNYDNSKIVVRIDPGMAFGTGHHETTELMIRFMLKYHKEGMDVLDLGTGSGILSIIAYKLLSNKILSIDNDPCIKENFKKNMLINNTKLNLEIRDCFDIKSFNYDMILANINKNILIDLLPLMVEKRGYVVLSGILEDDYVDIMKVIEKNNFNVVENSKINEWVGIVIR